MAASFFDNNGKLFVDCSECARALCKNAWKTSPYNGGCYDGILHYRIDKKRLVTLHENVSLIFQGGSI